MYIKLDVEIVDLYLLHIQPWYVWSFVATSRLLLGEDKTMLAEKMLKTESF